MPWQTPALKEVRSLVRDMIRGALPGADALVPNSVLRVLSDNQGALCHLTLQYIDWLALQLIPDTAETEWLDRHGDIWLVNADGTTGRKMATLASGTATFTSAVPGVGVVIPVGTRVGVVGGTEYETTEQFITSPSAIPSPGPIRALDPGTLGNQPEGTRLAIISPIPNLVTEAEVISLDGGVDTEDDDDLRIRVLQRIRQPPMGGAEHDYVRWALAVPGVTRAWCASEMGIGTVTVRFLMDDLRADNDGWPTEVDIETVTAYLDRMRPVAVKDIFVLAPVKQFIDVVIVQLVPDTNSVRAQIEESLQKMLLELAAPGQTIFAAWKSHAVMLSPSVISFQLGNTADDIMESPGHMAVLGDIIFS